jgi:hypothetical protein
MRVTPIVTPVWCGLALFVSCFAGSWVAALLAEAMGLWKKKVEYPNPLTPQRNFLTLSNPLIMKETHG